MFCTGCGNSIKTVDKFCSSCGKKLSAFNETNNTIITGEGSVSIVSSGKGNIKVGNLYATINSTEQAKQLEYSYTKKGKPFSLNKVRYLKIVSMSAGAIGTALGLVDSTLGILNNSSTMLGNNNSFIITAVSVIVLLISLLIHILYKELLTKGFIWIKPHNLINLKLKCNNDGTASLLDLSGVCPKPKCGGKIKLYKDNITGKIIGYCEKNHDHKFTFDHTDFSGKDIK
ncbi:zinc ribbon domain-containing protein [Clostridium sp. YIM B02515]|uniref:Zinc ribbon domain-containing protein n=1 Tax=Clostridium rhizosphaerae TaxID=2803861 RepID=A0ABS1T6G8_9CLOT|nr:zinc ribbon domain-containing protein [Clostridium rhizosphaerae]MBL4934251.1 zinc ribbon domain-containing protein [Clostridium rhizosphaerae]